MAVAGDGGARQTERRPSSSETEEGGEEEEDGGSGFFPPSSPTTVTEADGAVLGSLRSILSPATAHAAAVAALMQRVRREARDVRMGEVGGWRR